MSFSYKKVALLTVAITLLISSVLIMMFYRTKSTNITTYTLKAHNETVALYKNGEVIEIYNGIVLSNLPYSDKQKFLDGIQVESPEAADIFVENFDG